MGSSHGDLCWTRPRDPPQVRLLSNPAEKHTQQFRLAHKLNFRAGPALDQNDPNYDSEDDPCRRAADAEAARSAIAEDDNPVDISAAGEASEYGEVPGESSSSIVRAVNKLKEDVRCCLPFSRTVALQLFHVFYVLLLLLDPTNVSCCTLPQHDACRGLSIIMACLIYSG